MHKVKGAEQMSEKATPRGKPGRPRVNIPESEATASKTPESVVVEITSKLTTVVEAFPRYLCI